MKSFKKFGKIFNTKNIIIFGSLVLLVSILSGIGVYAYKKYRHTCEAPAQKEFDENIEVFNKMLTNSEKEDFERAQKMFSVGAEKHSCSKLKNFFRLYESNALWLCEKENDALKELEAVISNTKDESFVNFLLEIKQARMLADSQDKEKQETGLKALEQIVSKVNDGKKGVALYNLAIVYLDNNLDNKAKKAYEEMIEIFGEKSQIAQSIVNEIAIL